MARDRLVRRLSIKTSLRLELSALPNLGEPVKVVETPYKDPWFSSRAALKAFH